MNDQLLQYISVKEIEYAIFQMNPLGNPGPNGFPATFFQNH